MSEDDGRHLEVGTYTVDLVVRNQVSLCYPLTHLPQRSHYSHMLFTVAGDSGAWVIDNDRGRVCGHIMAWCSKHAWAYICPMQLLMEDMQRSLDATVITLPDILPEIEGKEVVGLCGAEVTTSQLQVSTLANLGNQLENLHIDGHPSASGPSTSAAAADDAETVDRSRQRTGPDASSVGRRPVMAGSRHLPSQLAWG